MEDASTNRTEECDENEIDLDDDDIDIDAQERTTSLEGEEDPVNQSEVFSDQHKLCHLDERRVIAERIDTAALDSGMASSARSTTMKDRLRLLKQKMNQARVLNQQAVQEEGQNGVLASPKKYSVAKAKASKLDPLTQQVASKVLHDAQQASEKEALNEFSVNDYHNPQGQFRNYQRNLKSLPSRQVQSNASTFDPTEAPANNRLSADATAAGREGARYMAQEMRRRIEKKQKRELKRKEKEMEEGDGDVNYINQRNKRFNQKINRTYDEATSEIRQNLERGTAL